MHYQYVEMYPLKNSKEYPNKPIEWLMFKDRKYLANLLSMMEKNYKGLNAKNELHQRLEILFKIGERITTEETCNLCLINQAKYFKLYRNNIRPMQGCLICEECYIIEKDIAYFNGYVIYPIKLSTIGKFLTKKDQAIIGDFLRNLIGINIGKKLTAKAAFEYFKSRTQSSYDLLF